jgi:hypothetical protein
MVAPRKPKDARRIIRRAKSKTAEAHLEEYDRLVSEAHSVNPSATLSRARQKEKVARERRLKWLGDQLFKGWRKGTPGTARKRTPGTARKRARKRTESYQH